MLVELETENGRIAVRPDAIELVREDLSDGSVAVRLTSGAWIHPNLTYEQMTFKEDMNRWSEEKGHWVLGKQE